VKKLYADGPCGGWGILQQTREGRSAVKGLYAQTLENSVRQFAITFLGLIGSNPQFEGAFRRLLPVPGLPASHRDRSEFFCHKRYTLFSLFSELQRDLISLRTKETSSAKRAQGQILGKPKDTLQKSKFDQNLEKIKELLGYGLSVRKIARVLGYTSHIALNTYINK
jgi:hypothetical protein